MENKKEKTAPDVSVGADTEQPISKKPTSSISENGGNIKTFEELQREMQLRSDPSYLQTISMNELFDTQYRSKQPLIDGLLYPGTYIFAGSPKLGKSFLMAQLAYHVSTGTPLWNYTTRKGTVLYLALEDDYRRLQERLYRMFGTESTDNLYFSVSASQLGNGLDEQLARFVAEHKDTKLIIIDTLQKVREVGGDNYSYANDYQIMARLKSFADAHGLCMLLVHHTRKQNADDKFDMISGTSGLLGAADGAFLLQKEKRTGNAATLEVSGRDQQDQKLYLVRNTETLLWDLQKAETELWKEPPEPLLDEIAELVMDVCTENDESGLVAAEKIKKTMPQIKVIIVTSLVECSFIDRARKAGVESFWYKDAGKEELLEVMDRTMKGENVYPDAPPVVMIGTAKSCDFTPGELAVLRLVVEGESYKKIAESLCISPETVKWHIKNMLQKTNFDSKTKLAVAVTKKNLIINGF